MPTYVAIQYVDNEKRVLGVSLSRDELVERIKRELVLGTLAAALDDENHAAVQALVNEGQRPSKAIDAVMGPAFMDRMTVAMQETWAEIRFEQES